MTAINLVASVHVGRHEKPVVSLYQKFPLVSRRVRTQNVVLIHIVRVGRRPPWMVSRKQQRVKVVLDRYDRIQIRKQAMMFKVTMDLGL
jgi:hypothetical protein